MYHITENGPKPCLAKNGNCPITKETGEKHYENFNQAQNIYETQMSQKYVLRKDNNSRKDKDIKSLYLKFLEIEPVSNTEEVISTTENDLNVLQYSLNNETKEYMRLFLNGEIPESLPESLSSRSYESNDFMIGVTVHQKSLDSGYYAKITKKFAKNLAESLDKNSVILDPMAGKGYFVKAMREQGIATIGSDDKSWDSAQTDVDNGIEDMSAIDSLKKYGNNITHMVISWAPYGSDIDEQLYQTVKKDFSHVTIINIGEGEGGCTGSEKFWESISEDKETEISHENQYGYQTTSGLHDFVTVVKINKQDDKE